MCNVASYERENTVTYIFPQGFTWGTATASYQVEGAIHEDGRTPSIWDTYCAIPGKILDGASGEYACDQYHRYQQDIALMRELGVGAYRFSVAWPRIIPHKGSAVNTAGVDYYNRLIDALLESGIKPVATLYHWDLPQYLEDDGGWPCRDTAYRFADYATVLAKAFGDRVDTWTTLNEPWCTAYLGYGNGGHAPGIKDHAQALAAVHHLNLAHGLGVQAVRAVVGEQARCSVTLNLQVNRPATDSPNDVAAVERADLFANEVFLGPMLEGRYDPRIMEATADLTDWAFVQDGDLVTIHQPLDVLGVNYYSTSTVRHVDSSRPANSSGLSDRHDNAMPAQSNVEVLPPEGELTAMGWNQDPQGLTDLLVSLSRRFPDLELMVTENGSAWDDTVDVDDTVPTVYGPPASDGNATIAVAGGRIVHDQHRVAYLKAHIAALVTAIQEGANVTGYYAWSLLDNFEWAFGYTKRFGIIRVDYPTQERIWKDSARYYQQLATTNSFQ